MGIMNEKFGTHKFNFYLKWKAHTGIPDTVTFILIGLISYFIVDGSLQKIRENK